MANRKNVPPIALLVASALILSAGCDTADTKEASRVRQQQQHYLETQPPPFFERSLERYLMIELYRARNSAVATWTYRLNEYTGKIIWQCPSIGYPIPGGTQLTNPEQNVGSQGAVIPQAEPNGMFSPQTSQGTYVMCVNDDGTVSPRYAEPLVETFPYPMTMTSDGELVPARPPSLRIDPKKAEAAATAIPTPANTETPTTPTTGS